MSLQETGPDLPDPTCTKKMAAREKRGHFHLSKVGKQCNQNDDWNRYTKKQ
jgi:hypothetical protein